jgi:hypothetical protein
LATLTVSVAVPFFLLRLTSPRVKVFEGTNTAAMLRRASGLGTKTPD